MTTAQMNNLRNDCEISFKGVNESLEELRNQIILITGGTGFMGKWLTEAIVFLNVHHNYNIKLYLLARNTEFFRTSVPHLAKHKFIKLIEQDIKSVSELPYDINYVIHAAASPDSREHNTQPLKTVNTIVKGTTNILEACWRLQALNKIINVSSNNIYGHIDSNVNGIRENQMGYLDCNLVGSIYAESKRTAEAICAAFKNQQRLPIITVRPFTFIGPYQSLEKPWAANNFMRDALLGGPIRILGDENTVRSYLYGSDMAIWILKILAVGKVNVTYNIGGEVGISLKELAKIVAGNFSEKIEIQVKSSKEFIEKHSFSIPDLQLLKKDCKVSQQIALEESISKTIRFNEIEKVNI